MTFCFDLDETLCTGKPYKLAKPLIKNIELVNRLKSSGHVIIIHTARGMSTYNGDVEEVVKHLKDLTLSQLREWNVAYDKLIFGKPSADIYIDDKGCNINNIVKNSETKVEDLINRLEKVLGGFDG